MTLGKTNAPGGKRGWLPAWAPGRLGGADVDAVPAGAAVGLWQDERLRLNLARTVGCPHDKRGPRARLQREGALPADHGVAARWRLEDAGRLPRLAAVGAELDLVDAANAGVGDARDPLRPRRQTRTVDGDIDPRHGLDNPPRGPAALVVPAGERLAHGTDADQPFRALHAIAAGHEQPGRVAVLARQDLAVHLVDDECVRVGCRFNC